MLLIFLTICSNSMSYETLLLNFLGSAEPILTKPPALKEQNVLDSKKAYVF